MWGGRGGGGLGWRGGVEGVGHILHGQAGEGVATDGEVCKGGVERVLEGSERSEAGQPRRICS